MKLMRWGTAFAFILLAACSDAPTALQPEGGDSERRAAPSQKPAESPTVVDVAIAVNEETGEFGTLIAAVIEADLAGALSAKGQRTVFAPTDAAFDALGLNADNIGEALDDDALEDILLYHVAHGRRYAEDVVSSDRIRMLNRDFNRVSITGEGAFIGEAQIIQTDVEATNGIIHVIDAVLLPPMDDGADASDDEDEDDDDDEGVGDND